jgi:hypothetical protein
MYTSTWHIVYTIFEGLRGKCRGWVPFRFQSHSRGLSPGSGLSPVSGLSPSRGWVHSGLSPSRGWVHSGFSPIRGWVSFGVESHSGLGPFGVQSHSGFSPFGVESHSGLGPFEVQSILGSVHSRLSLSRFGLSRFNRSRFSRISKRPATTYPEKNPDATVSLVDVPVRDRNRQTMVITNITRDNEAQEKIVKLWMS